MFLRNFALSLLHRWYLVLLGLALAGFGAFQAWDQTPTRYETQVSVLLLPPSNVTKGTLPRGGDGNPLLYLGGLSQARDVLLNAMTTTAMQEEFEELFPDREFSVAMDHLSTGPIIVIRTVAPDAQSSLDSINYLSQRLHETLDQMQSELKVKKDAKIGSLQLTTEPIPEQNDQSRIRVATVVGVGLTATTVFLIGFIDGLVVRARARHASDDEIGEASQEDLPEKEALREEESLPEEEAQPEEEALPEEEAQPEEEALPEERDRSEEEGLPDGDRSEEDDTLEEEGDADADARPSSDIKESPRRATGDSSFAGENEQHFQPH